MADFVKDGVSTAEIAKYLTLSALSLTTVTDPDWKNAAGRLKLFELYKQMSETRQTGKNYNNLYDYPQFLKFAEENGIYSKRISEVYSEEEIKLAAGFIEPKFDLVYDYAGINLLIKRYLCEYGDRIVELPQDMFLSIALLIEQNADKDIRLGLVKDTYEKLANRKISLATPLLMNLRRPNGNLSSCFITVMDDSRDSIFYVIDQISAISKFGGGVGCNLSRVRCKGARIKGIKNSSGGVIPWIRIINDTAVAVNQQGKRKGAVTVSLDMWHLDIEDFLELRTENGDQRMKAYDIFPQVVIPDLFMKKVESNENWLLVDPSEVRRVYGKEIADLWGDEFEKLYNQLYLDAQFGKLEMFKFVPAKELLKRVMKSQVETGMPYIAFKDTLNRMNPNKHDGVIVGTNLCTESHSNVRPTQFEKNAWKAAGLFRKRVTVWCMCAIWYRLTWRMLTAMKNWKASATRRCGFWITRLILPRCRFWRVRCIIGVIGPSVSVRWDWPTIWPSGIFPITLRPTMWTICLKSLLFTIFRPASIWQRKKARLALMRVPTGQKG